MHASSPIGADSRGSALGVCVALSYVEMCVLAFRLCISSKRKVGLEQYTALLETQLLKSLTIPTRLLHVVYKIVYMNFFALFVCYKAFEL